MDARVLYLDIDDEITTAAARVRSSDASRIAIVLPYGSRVATSRINFRLLARDATLNGKRLSIVAGDAATRALAASAGLPIFASVAEYESSTDVDDGGGATDTGEGSATGVAGAPPLAPAVAAPVRTSRSPRGTGRRKPRGAAGDDTSAAIVDQLDAGLAPAIGSATVASPIGPVDAHPPGGAREPGDATSSVAVRIPAAVPAARVMADNPPDEAPHTPLLAGSRVLPAPRTLPSGSRLIRAPLALGAAVLALALVVGGVGAYVFLPTATAVITPRETAIGPVQLRIVADAAAVEPDPVAKTVPADTMSIDVEASQTFTVTGKRVEEVEAKGTVRFRNFDADATNTIPRGSIVATRSGIRFRTDRAVTIPRAEQVLFQVFPASANVTVTAVDGGPDGNVGRNMIRVIPRGEDPQTIDVTNLDETSGGKRDEFPRLGRADVEAATAALGEQLAVAFAARVADPALAGDGATVFAETAALGEPVFPTDPATLLGNEVETFDLSATATGTVLAVDESAVRVVAEANIAAQVQPGYALVDGSSQVEPSPGQVVGGVISFQTVITARQMLVLDPTAIEAEIRGKSLAEAQSILDGYGRAELTAWPDWVGTVPTLDARVDVQAAPAEAP